MIEWSDSEGEKLVFITFWIVVKHLTIAVMLRVKWKD